MKTIVLATLMLFLELAGQCQNRPHFTIIGAIGDTTYSEREGSVKIYPHAITVSDETVGKIFYLTRMRDTSYCSVSDTTKRDFHFVARYEVLVTLNNAPEPATFFIIKELKDKIFWNVFLYTKEAIESGVGEKIFMYDVVDDSIASVLNLKKSFLETFK